MIYLKKALAIAVTYSDLDIPRLNKIVRTLVTERRNG